MKRMKIWILIFFCSVVCDQLLAQEIVLNNLRRETSRTIKKDPDTTTWTFKRGGLLSLNLSQGSLSNWAAGGDNFSLAASSYFNYFFFFKKGRHFWDNNLDVNLGYVQTTSLGSRKNDDRIDFLSKYGLKADSADRWYVSSLFNFRSQFFDGYTFPGGTPTFASTILSPAYVLLSAGVEYKEGVKFSMFLSPITSRWVIVLNQTLANQKAYGVDSGKHTINQVGAFATFNYNNEIYKNINYKGRLDLFSNYKNQPQNINIFMTNQFSFKINKYFSATYSLDLIYDDNIRIFGKNGTSAALQVKSLIGIGFLKVLSVKKT